MKTKIIGLRRLFDKEDFTVNVTAIDQNKKTNVRRIFKFQI
jgi:hypothetical protein